MFGPIRYCYSFQKWFKWSAIMCNFEMVSTDDFSEVMLLVTFERKFLWKIEVIGEQISKKEKKEKINWWETY